MKHLFLALVFTLWSLAAQAATYEELADLFANNQGLRAKVVVAATVKAEAIFAEATPSAARLQWAQDVLANPESVGNQLLSYVLAANKGATVAVITGATDASIQANVDTAIDKMVP